MAEPSAAARLSDISALRNKVTANPLADGLDAGEVQTYLLGLPVARFPETAFEQSTGVPCIQPRGGLPLFDDQLRLTKALDQAGSDFLPLTIDSYTRLNDYGTAQELLQRSEDEEKNYLNGYPLVSHGFELTRSLFDGIDKPISLRHGTPDARLLVELAIASGISEIEGGGICYCLPYSEGFPLDRSLLYWQYVDRVCAWYSTEDRPIHRESFGVLSATLVPPAIAVSIEIIELLLAAEQGVTSFSVSFGQSGSISQDIATAHVLRDLARKYLDRFGFEDVKVYLAYHQWMGQFPANRDKASALIASGAMVASMVHADKVVVKTVDEALGVPEIENNAAAVEFVAYLLRISKSMAPLTSTLVEDEIELIASESNTILERIFELSGTMFWESVFRAFRAGYLDVPFCPHGNNANKLISMRDNNASIRIYNQGDVPISAKDAQVEKRLLAQRVSQSASTYKHLLTDINMMMY